MRTHIYSGSPWEARFGYARAVRAGRWICVSGTTGTQQGRVVGQGDVRAQVDQAVAIIRDALRQAGADLHHVVRWRLYLTDMSRWEEAAQAVARHFAPVRPAATLVGVSSLIHPDMLVEIEVDAVVDDDASNSALDRGAGVG
jgi:enamine deaminase RidA (YjgF/YER057c/UK114 family)